MWDWTDSEGNEKKGLPIIRIIDIYDEDFINISRKKEAKEFDELPPSLLYAIDCFLVAGALRLARNQGEEHISMLIHGSYLQKEQGKVHEQVERQVRLRRSEIYRDLTTTLNLFIQIKEKEFEPTTSKLGIASDKINNNDFKRNLKFFIDNVMGQIILDNSGSDKRLSFEEKFWGIVVGGNTLSRGLTIEGLTITYFIRSSKMYDSLMQMGRWFGYRPGYLDLMRIFITEKLSNIFYEMASVENEIREEISAMAELDERPTDLRIRIRQHPGMRVTAKNKMKNAIAVEYSFSGRRVQPRYINITKQMLKGNEKAIFSLLNNIQNQAALKATNGFSNFRTSLLYRGIKKETILQFLDNYEISSANKRLTNSFIQNFIEKNKNLDFNVAVISQITDGTSYTLPNNEKVNLINRSPALEIKDDLDLDAIYIKGLAIPRDEMIDMFEHIPNAPTNVDEVVNAENTKQSFSLVRRKFRPKNESLLILYPINPDSINRELKDKITAPVVWGIMFVFPDEETLAKGKYIINSSINKDTSNLPGKKIKLPNSKEVNNILKDVPTGRAISIKQPYIEEILIGKKKYEYRSRRTHIRGRVFLYASSTLGDTTNCKKYNIDPELLPYGQIVGSVEIVDCVYFEKQRCYGYELKNPVRFSKPIKNQNKAQPCFFFAFNVDK